MRHGSEIERLLSQPRQRYLAVAAEVAASQSTRHFAVSHVTIGAVAAMAEVSRGALYRLWPSQQDYWNDLIDFLMHGRPGAVATGTTDPRTTSAHRAEPFLDTAQHLLLADTQTLLRTATADATSPAGVRRLDERRAARLRQLADALDRLTRSGGRRWAAGVLPTDLAALVMALGSGLPVVARMCPPEDLRFDSPWFARPSEAPRSMLGVVTEAMRDRLTEAGEAARPSAAADGPCAAREPAPNVAGRRHVYLEIGARLALTRDGTAAHRVLGHVTLESVARAAGVSRRTVATVWPDQDTFRLDLFGHLLSLERGAVIAAVRDAAVRHESDRPAADAFRDVGTDIRQRLVAAVDRPTFRAFAAQLDDPTLAARAMAEHRRLAEACTLQLHRLLATTNRRLRAGVIGRQLAVALFALDDGFATLLRTSPSAVRDGIGAAADRQGHHTIELAVEALFDAFSEPLDGTAEISRYVDLIS